MDPVGPTGAGQSPMPDPPQTPSSSSPLLPPWAKAPDQSAPVWSNPTAPPAADQIESFIHSGDGFHFSASAEGPEGTGAFYDQASQACYTALLSGAAAASVATHGEQPSDETIHTLIDALGINKPLPGEPTATADYQSTICHAPPQVLYDAFVENPDRFFAAAGLKIRPLPAHGLETGVRFMLEDGSTPPIWAPVEVRLDPERRRIQFVCLDGHPLRGVNEFRFEPDGHGGTKVDQHSEFQGSSTPTTLLGVHVMKALERQHAIWQSVHGELGKVTR